MGINEEKLNALLSDLLTCIEKIKSTLNQTNNLVNGMNHSNMDIITELKANYTSLSHNIPIIEKNLNNIISDLVIVRDNYHNVEQLSGLLFSSDKQDTK